MKEEAEAIKIIKEKIVEAELVLVGIGESFAQRENDGKLEQAYKKLSELLNGKNYFLITTCVDELIYDVGLKEDRIVRPLAEEENEEVLPEAGAGKHLPRWETYMKWLQGTVNRKVLVLELGVGLKYPGMIRFPFEKMIYFNQKADFVRIHDKLYQMPAELNGRGLSIEADPVMLLTHEEG